MREIKGSCYYCKKPVYDDEKKCCFTKRKRKGVIIYDDWFHMDCYIEYMQHFNDIFKERCEEARNNGKDTEEICI